MYEELPRELAAQLEVAQLEVESVIVFHPRRVQPARSGGDDVDDGRIIHSAAQKKGEERVLCVCACATERRSESGLSIVILVRYVLKKYAAGLNESLRKSMEYRNAQKRGRGGTRDSKKRPTER